MCAEVENGRERRNGRQEETVRMVKWVRGVGQMYLRRSVKLHVRMQRGHWKEASGRKPGKVERSLNKVSRVRRHGKKRKNTNVNYE